MLLVNLHNSLWHGWEEVINKRANGTAILLSGRIGILHDSVLAHCPTLSGVNDGILEDPVGSCKFDPAWVQCKAGEKDTSKCLTPEETAVAKKYYDGVRRTRALFRARRFSARFRVDMEPAGNRQRRPELAAAWPTQTPSTC